MSKTPTDSCAHAQKIAQALSDLQTASFALAKLTPDMSGWAYRNRDLTVAAWNYVNAVKNSQKSR